MNSAVSSSRAWRGRLAVALQIVIVIALVVALSHVLRTTLAEPKEESPSLIDLQLSAQMTLGQVAQRNELPPKLVAKALEAELPAQAGVTLGELGVSVEDARVALSRAHALMVERQTKDFGKIFLKFGLWIVLLVLPLVLLIRRGVSRTWRLAMLVGAVVIFGVVLGSDPSPMGTIKDMIALGGAHRVVFIPRLIALAVFLAIVIVANKFICSWGCQFGTLQELLYRLNRRGKPRRGVFPLIRLPYAVSNTIRIVFFVVFTIVAFAWAFDLIGPIDPFKVYHPAVLGALGAVFVLVLLLFSAVIYRPWCHLACPFGLVSWLCERLSIWRVGVDYDKCTACRTCMNHCPSEAMKGILLGEALPSDCFSCGDCLSACPTGAVQYTHRWGIPRSAERSGKIETLRAK
jgi:polyferredoxin